MFLPTLAALSSALLSSLFLLNAAAAQTVRVALLPVVVHTSDQESGHVSEGLGDMLSARIERSGEVSVVRVSDPATTNPTDAILAAKKAGTEYVLFGSFTQFGAGASLDIRCAPVSDGESPDEGVGTRHIFIQTGTRQEIIPKLDDLSDKIIRYLVSGTARPAPRPTAASVESTDAPEDAVRDPLTELRSRVEALERTVYPDTSLREDEQPSVAGAPQ